MHGFLYPEMLHLKGRLFFFSKISNQVVPLQGRQGLNLMFTAELT